jgi:Ca2+-binding EF-hand superfamily protein
MKTLPIALSLTAAFALPAFAQDPERPRRERPDRPAASDVAKGAPSVLAALDRNRDGKLDQNEIDMAVVALRRMDANKDGTISADEMVAPTRSPGRRPDGPPPGGEGGDRPRRGSAPNFAELDKDSDGKISKEEAPERMKERFGQMDQNGDGYLDKEEQDRIAQFIRERMRGAGQGGDRRRQPESGQGETERPTRPPIEE